MGIRASGNRSSRRGVWRQSNMAGLELLSDQGYRVDGRRAGELRKIQARMGVFAQADGSAYIEQGNTKALAVVYGPHEASGRARAGHRGRVGAGSGGRGRRVSVYAAHLRGRGSIGLKVEVLAPRCTVVPALSTGHCLLRPPLLRALPRGARHAPPRFLTSLRRLHRLDDTSPDHLIQVPSPTTTRFPAFQHLSPQTPI